MASRATGRRRPSPRGLLAGLALGLALPLAAQAATATLGVAATVVSKNKCTISGTIPALNFGEIDPSASADAVATTSVSFVCRGSSSSATFVFGSNDGLYKAGAGAPRMRHATTTTEYLRYSLAFSPASATVPKNSTQTVTIKGTISPTYFATALAGSYSDTVTISLNP